MEVPYKELSIHSMQDEQEWTSWSWEELVDLYAAIDGRDKSINRTEYNADLILKEDNSWMGLLLFDVKNYHNKALECRYTVVRL